jgi:hypothetical protein
MDVSDWLPMTLPITACVLGMMMFLIKRGLIKQAKIACALGIAGFIAASLWLSLPCASGGVTYDEAARTFRGCENWQFAIVTSFLYASTLSVLILCAAMIWTTRSNKEFNKEA